MISSLKIDAGLSADQSSSTPSTPAASVDGSTSFTSERRTSTTSEAYKTLPISKRGQFFKDDYFKNVWNDFDSAMDEMVGRQKLRQEKRQEDRMKRDQAREQVLQQMMSEQAEQSKRLRAEKLERQRKASQEMQQMMFQSPLVDRLSSYKTLRTWAGGDESQAQTITSDEKAYKVIISHIYKNVDNTGLHF